jgi:hypothetical protein
MTSFVRGDDMQARCQTEANAWDEGVPEVNAGKVDTGVSAQESPDLRL